MDRIEWLRAEIQADMDAAKIISDGGFVPQRWDTDPPAQVNPEGAAGSEAINDALRLDPGDYEWANQRPGWVVLYAYERLNNEPPEADSLSSAEPSVLANHGRREFDHIRRQDPRNTVARCEAELAILDHCIPGDAMHKMLDSGIISAEEYVSHEAIGAAVVRHLASAYRHRPGYEDHWGTAPPK